MQSQDNYAMQSQDNYVILTLHIRTAECTDKYT